MTCNNEPRKNEVVLVDLKPRQKDPNAPSDTHAKKGEKERNKRQKREEGKIKTGNKIATIIAKVPNNRRRNVGSQKNNYFPLGWWRGGRRISAVREASLAPHLPFQTLPSAPAPSPPLPSLSPFPKFLLSFPSSCSIVFPLRSL